jgi:hypothetical protein
MEILGAFEDHARKYHDFHCFPIKNDASRTQRGRRTYLNESGLGAVGGEKGRRGISSSVGFMVILRYINRNAS